MNSTTSWIISPNWMAWTLLSISTASLAAIAIRLWTQHQTAQTSYRNRFGIVAWIAFIMALISIVGIFFKSPEPTEASILIAALGVMVTLLVGWQIFNAITFKEAVNRINQLEQLALGYHEASIGVSELNHSLPNSLFQCVLALERLNNSINAEYENVANAIRVISEVPPQERFMITALDKRRIDNALRNSHNSQCEQLVGVFKNWPER